MRCLRFLPLLALPCLTMFVTGALTRQTPCAASLTVPAPIFPLRADAAAAQALAQAIDAVSPEHVRWLQTQLWQQVRLPHLSYQAEGTYLAGPDHRLHLDLRVRTEGSTSRFQLISDGQTLWQVEERATSGRSVGRVHLAQLAETPKREEFYRGRCFLGLAPLLRSLQQQVTFIRTDALRWRGQDIVLLTGAWATPPADGNWPEGFPRQCRLFLDARTSWPHRIEWWGPASSDRGDCLLHQMEFRRPLLGQTQPDAEFAFDPGNDAVKDLTQQWMEPLP
jgi:hypothetical protein